MCKSKIHRATLTHADLGYEGSLTVDVDLLEAADMMPYERVQVVNINNGIRYETYLLAGERGSGVVQANGGAARLGLPGDLVIILTYAEYEDSALAGFETTVVHVSADNRPLARALR